MAPRKPELKPGSGARCPICGRPATPRSRPFCSPRCADIDLGRWLTGQYVVPGPPAELDEDPPPFDDRPA
jgi:endogenous inhibitor of DNA gyrase (YacG/DUF329 family)